CHSTRESHLKSFVWRTTMITAKVLRSSSRATRSLAQRPSEVTTAYSVALRTPLVHLEMTACSVRTRGLLLVRMSPHHRLPQVSLVLITISTTIPATLHPYL